MHSVSFATQGNLLRHLLMACLMLIIKACNFDKVALAIPATCQALRQAVFAVKEPARTGCIVHAMHFGQSHLLPFAAGPVSRAGAVIVISPVHMGLDLWPSLPLCWTKSSWQCQRILHASCADHNFFALALCCSAQQQLFMSKLPMIGSHIKHSLHLLGT